MGLRQFKSDLAAAKSATFARVSEINNGDSDGEVVFKYFFGDLDPVEVRALATDVDSYPRGSGFLIFTSSENAGQDLEHFIQELSASVDGKGVADLVQTVSKRLTARLEGDNSSSEDVESLPDEDDFADFSGSDEYMSDVDIDPLPPRRRIVTPPQYDRGTLRRLKEDLIAAREAGYRVSILLLNGSARLFSISIRISKLGIPEEALEAWGLRERDHIVLLIKLSGGYPSVSDFVKLSSDQTSAQFRFGKCVKAKPALASACAAFEVRETKGGDEETGPSSTTKGMQDDTFELLHMSASLNPLLNQELPLLLNLRRQLEISWDEAQTIKFNRVRTSHVLDQQMAKMEQTEIVVDTNDVPSTQAYIPDFLRHDYALDQGESMNIILVAMQLGLLRLVRCNQYCMVCHQKVKSLEAIKPYVCDEPLCLYQYLSLGFGQSIEHEIINNPYVIDLLICFFYSAAMNNGFREVPRGLGLTFPHVGDKHGLTPYHNAEAHFQNKTVRFPVGKDSSYVSMKEGDSILLIIDRSYTDITQSISSGNCERYQCIVDRMHGHSFTFKILATFTTPHNVQQIDSATFAAQNQDEWIKVLVFRAVKDVDELEGQTQNLALAHLTHTIPSVPEMRKWLLKHPGRRLSSWTGIYRSSLSLLNWIVASNRSHLIQEGPLRTQPFPDSSYDMPKSENAIKDVSQCYWMQFRFIQGSPEKDVMFKQELDNMNTTHGGQHPHPTIFAWHGSPLKNWHSIIRVGLDFQMTQHGRAFGNGVYFSNSINVSQGYSGPSFPSHIMGISWQNSVLKVRSAISICEIVNQPEKFVSQQPHYVVNNVGWIQCRYLFAQVCASEELQQLPTLDTTEKISQDPNRLLIGERATQVQIPISALPLARRRKLMREGVRAVEPGGSTANPIIIDEEESEVDEDDLSLIDDDSEDREFSLSTDRKRQHSPDLATPDDRPAKLTTGAQEAEFNRLRLGNDPTDLETTDFRPGSLDLALLPQMREPTWASSSPFALKRLHREIKDLQKIQASHNIEKLGWYIDFEKVNNLFQWIVELHSFDENLPLAKDMKRLNCQSIVLEIRFGASFPMSPPFVRVIRPKFRLFSAGGGGHVLSGGAMCTELLTNSGWSPALSMEKVFLEVRMQLSEVDPPARLIETNNGQICDYFIGEAVASFRQAVRMHGWQMPSDLDNLVTFEAPSV